MQRISSGNAQIDRVLDGGFPANSLHVVMGQPGTGKTIFVEQMAFANVSSDRPVLYLTTLSEPLTKVIQFLQEYSIGDVEQIGVGIIYESIGDSVAESPEALTSLLTELIKQYRPRVIVIDSFKAIADLLPDRTRWRRLLYGLAGLLAAYDATTFWIGEYTVDMISDLPEFAIADGIIELTRTQHGTRDDRHLRVVKLRGSNFIDGYHALRISNEGLELFPRLVTPRIAPNYDYQTERLATGLPGLDGMIASGWLRGSSTIVAGPAGSGKTAVSLHFLKEGVSRGESCLMVNFQENPTQLARTMASFGWDPRSLIGSGKLDIFYTSPVELQIDSIVSELLERIVRNHVQRVVIDAVGDLEGTARDPLRFRDYLYALCQHFATQGITAMIALEATGHFEAQGTGKALSYMSDNLLLLEMHLGETLERTIRVLKSRASAHDGRRHTLHITAQGILVE